MIKLHKLYKKETGKDYLYPRPYAIYGTYTQEYVEWLENFIERFMNETSNTTSKTN